MQSIIIYFTFNSINCFIVVTSINPHQCKTHLITINFYPSIDVTE